MDAAAVRCLFCDLDGTLLGAGASLLRDADGAFTLLGARALEACHRADVEVVLYSGRRRAQLDEDARLLGAAGHVFEVGGGVVLDREVTWLVPEGDRTYERTATSGAGAALQDAFPLEGHDPWHPEREVSPLLRGWIDPAEAEAFLADRGWGGLRLLDNGVVRRRSERLAGVPEVRAYHLVPAGISKAAGVAHVLRMRGYAPEHCVAGGGSAADLEGAGVGGTFWLGGARAPPGRPDVPGAQARARGGAL